MTSHQPLADHYGQSETGMLVNCHWGDTFLTHNKTQNEGIQIEEQEQEQEITLNKYYPYGSMGTSMPGYKCTLVNNNHEEINLESQKLSEFEQTGQLAVDISSSPLYWFQGYWNQPEKTLKSYSKDKKYYLTGDISKVNFPFSSTLKPIFWYISRNDDIITSSGYRIGPSDIERCLLKDNRVRDVAVFGVPDPEGLRGEVTYT